MHWSVMYLPFESCRYVLVGWAAQGRLRPSVSLYPGFAVLPEAESIPVHLAHRELCRSLNVDDGARLAGVGIQHGDFAGDGSGE
jgi:hypothetical protein